MPSRITQRGPVLPRVGVLVRTRASTTASEMTGASAWSQRSRSKTDLRAPACARRPSSLSPLCESQTQRGQDSWLVGEVADQDSHRKRSLLDKGGHSQNPAGDNFCGLRIDVDDVQVVAGGSVSVAHVAQPTLCPGGSG